MSDRPWKYYQYKCLPSSELRGKRKEHEEGYCGRPILRKSKESLPIQGSPCPECSRRTRINRQNLDMPETNQHGMPLRRKWDEMMKNRFFMNDIFREKYHEWKNEEETQ